MKRKDDSKIEKIQDAVIKIILSEGTANVSTIKVAKLVGIAQSNVYLYFKNKNSLLISVYKREMNRISEYSQFHRLADHDLSVEQRIDIYLKSIYEYSLAYPESLTIIEQIKSMNISHEDIYTSNSIVSELLNEGIKTNYLKGLPVNLHMSVVFNLMHRHALNIKNNIYKKDTYSYESIKQMALDAIKKNED